MSQPTFNKAQFQAALTRQWQRFGLHAAEDMTYGQSFAYTNEVFARLCSTGDAGEGVRAFLEKRQPTWQGK